MKKTGGKGSSREKGTGGTKVRGKKKGGKTEENKKKRELETMVRVRHITYIESGLTVG